MINLKELGFAVATTATVAALSAMTMISLMGTTEGHDLPAAATAQVETPDDLRTHHLGVKLLGCEPKWLSDYTGYVTKVKIKVCRLSKPTPLTNADISLISRRMRPGLRPAIRWAIEGQAADVKGVYLNELQRWRFVRDTSQVHSSNSTAMTITLN